MTEKMPLEEIEGLAKNIPLERWEASEPNGNGHGFLVRGADAWLGRKSWSDETRNTAHLIANVPRLLEIAREQRETIRKLQQFSCEACADADSCDRVGRSANRQCAAFRVGTKK